MLVVQQIEGLFVLTRLTLLKKIKIIIAATVNVVKTNLMIKALE